MAVAPSAAARPPEFWQRLAGSRLTAAEIEALAPGLEQDVPGAEAAREAFAQGAGVWMMEDGLAPGFLFTLGDVAALGRPRVAIVGTRRATPYGVAAAQAFATALAGAGVTVVSGGARGIDTAAHRSAIEAGATVTVLPSGVDVCYPAANRPLFEQVRQRGCLVSQFRCGSGVGPENLLARNRTVARLSHATVVIEAPQGSGALVTARHALELGKPVHVVPGPYTLSSFAGGYGLLQEGATLASDPVELASLYGSAVSPKAPPYSSDLLGLLASGPMTAEALGRVTGLSPVELMESLTSLELEGYVTRVGDGYACVL